ncbi:hypothetical protein JJV70_05695 [Streptomyces sp. JJ66]|nr:hypothetical protein [Streptomyces sp. JJ66]
MNMQEAANRADTVLDMTLKAIKPEVEWVYGETTSQACTDWKNEETETGAVSRRRAVTTIISKERRGNFLGGVEDFWKKSGYEIIAVRDSATHPAVYAETPEGFRIRLMFGAKGQALLQASTPCAEQSDVTDPKEDTGPAPAPNAESDFWSASGNS